MGSIKDKALKNDAESQTFTLTQTEINGLLESRKLAQQTLDFMLQNLTTIHLTQVAVGRFGYKETEKLDFKLDLEKKTDNITITKLA